MLGRNSPPGVFITLTKNKIMTKPAKKLDLNKLEAKDGTLTVIVREDKPLEVQPLDKAVKISGTIASPGNFYESRREQLKDVIKKSHVVFNYRLLFIQLNAIENNAINTEVKGSLTLNPDLSKFSINTNTKVSSKDLYDFLKMNKFFFADKAQCNAIIEKLQSTKTTVEKNIETNLNNGTGNQKNVYDLVVRGIEPTFFDLNLPIYVGQDPITFRVEVNIDARTGEVLFYLESVILEEIKLSEAKRIMDSELKRFENSGLVMIEQ